MPMHTGRRDREEDCVTLQGDLDTFPLPDVLRLLAGTAKTGGLHVRGPDGQGSLWFVGGEVAHGSIGAAPAPVTEVIFSLLRGLGETFTFEATVPPQPDEEQTPVAVEEAIASAEARLVEWHDLLAVVGSPEALVTRSPAIAGPVTLSPEQWALLGTIGDGSSSVEVADRSGIGQFDVLRGVRDLCEMGVVVVAEPPEPIGPVAWDEPADPVAWDQPVTSAVWAPEPGRAPEPIAAGGLSPEDWAEVANTVADVVASVDEVPTPSAAADDPEVVASGADEVEQDRFDRSLLLRFLGSVEG
jgi:hypothetical protein